MPKQIVNISDTVKTFQEKVNIISADVGWRGNLTTDTDSDLVGAINELENEIDVLQGQVSQLDSDTGALQLGDLSSLQTTAKDTLVNAINETLNSHPTHPGDDIDIDTGALTGATVISDLDINITTDSSGHVTDANATVATRSITAANVSALPTAGGTMTGDINFGDGDKAIFGAGNDLQIYHFNDQNNIVGGDTLNIWGRNIDSGSNSIILGAVDATYATFDFIGAVKLYYNNAEKLGTTDSGIDVTGNVNGRDISVDGGKLDTIEASANNYSLPLATNTLRGGIQLFNNTDQSVAANAVTTTASRTYGLQLNSANQGVINVPWTDTNLNHTGDVTSISDGTTTIADDAVSRAKLKDEVSLIIKDSTGAPLKTLYGAGS